MTVTVLIVDDDPLLRAGIESVLETADDIEVIGQADSGISALASVVDSPPDVVLMDVRMPGMNGIEATRRIIDAVPDTKVLVLTTFGHDEYVFDALRAGASGFLLKRIPPERLIEAIHTVAGGEALLDSVVTMGLSRASTEQAGRLSDDRALEPLTDKEREVLRLVGLGLANAEIGAELYIAESTAKTHLRRIFIKLGLHDRAQAVILAYRPVW